MIHLRRWSVLCLLALASSACSAPGPAPDVLLVVVDTLRPDFLGAYGFRQPTSPHVDALAKRGVVFDRALAASTLTTPSHASMMTSLWVNEHSIGYSNGTTRLADEVTLARRFQQSGYDTAAFVGNIMIGSPTGLDAGFDVYDDELPDAELHRANVFERGAGDTADRALAWLADRGEAPFFLWVHFQDPHGPYEPPAPYDRGFEGLAEEGERPLRVLTSNTGRHGIPAYQEIPELREPGDYRSRYAGEVAFFDAHLGRILAAVEERGRPLIVGFTADHAESMGEADFWFAHGHATTPDIARIPMILVAPGLEAGRRDELVHHVDVVPTLLDLAGIPAGESRGLPLGRFLRDGAAIPDRTLFTDIGRDTAAYRGNHFVRIWNRAGGRGRAVGSFRWSPADGWQRESTPPELLEELRAHLGTRKPFSHIPDPLLRDQRARLRALGYLEPDSADPGTPEPKAAAPADR